MPAKGETFLLCFTLQTAYCCVLLQIPFKSDLTCSGVFGTTVSPLYWRKTFAYWTKRKN